MVFTYQKWNHWDDYSNITPEPFFNLQVEIGLIKTLQGVWTIYSTRDIRT